MRKIDRIVAGVLLYWIFFVVTAWVVFCVKDAIPDTLVQVGLGGGAVELLATAAIEILSNKEKKSEVCSDGCGDICDNCNCGADCEPDRVGEGGEVG